MSIVIIKYNAGNIFSVDSAMKRLGVDAIVSDDKELIANADKVIFPGVGEASTTMSYLKENNLDTLIKGLKQPVLGICLGMQLMCSHSEEGDADCLGIFDVDVKRFVSKRHEDKIPHMGWNTITDVKTPIFDTLLENQYVYFVHSYYVPVNTHTSAITDYILPFSAALHKDNFYATQFHPEKSGSVGEQILTNFPKVMIEIIPAIDIIDGKCVRLSQGDYNTKTIYNENPLEVAKQFEGAGIHRVHLVDLDGAKAKHVINHKVLEDIATHTSLVIDFGGGIQSDKDIDIAFEAGAAMVTGGSVAAKNRKLFVSWVEKYGGDRIILGADSKNNQIAVSGWQEATSLAVVPYISNYIQYGVKKVVCTDISKDGMLEGPAIDLYKKILDHIPDVYLIASGGVSCKQDILNLEAAGVPAIIMGKAIYENKVTLKDLVEIQNRK